MVLQWFCVIFVLGSPYIRFLDTLPPNIYSTQFKLFFSIKLIFMLYYSSVKVGGNFLENDFWTPPLLSILYMILNVRLVAAALGPLACSKATALGPESVIT